jgi:hypothetical protein
MNHGWLNQKKMTFSDVKKKSVIHVGYQGEPFGNDCSTLVRKIGRQ